MDALTNLRAAQGLFGCHTCRRAWIIQAVGVDITSAVNNITNKADKLHRQGRVVCDGESHLVKIEEVEEDWKCADITGEILPYDEFFEVALDLED